VVTLAQQPLQSGSHSIIWDGTDSLAQPVSSGIYFYRMRVGSYTASRKMILMK
jgi:flagellar hook assembly protein FlgD